MINGDAYLIGLEESLRPQSINSPTSQKKGFDSEGLKHQSSGVQPPKTKGQIPNRIASFAEVRLLTSKPTVASLIIQHSYRLSLIDKTFGAMGVKEDPDHLRISKPCEHLMPNNLVTIRPLMVSGCQGGIENIINRGPTVKKSKTFSKYQTSAKMFP